MDKKDTFYTFLAMGSFATTGGLVGLFVKLLAFLVNASRNTPQFTGGIFLAGLCIAAALVALAVLFYAMRKIKQLDGAAQKEQDESNKKSQELQELQIALLKSKLASVTTEGDVVIKDGKLVIDVSNKNIVMQVDSSSHQYGSQINLTIKSDNSAERHCNTDIGSSQSANISDEEK